ncbi:MAG TPA: endolytic transglycosylase MltG [Segetibacter sp.]|jgi:UPF0755 protein
MKKVILAVIVILVITGAVATWLVLGSATAFTEKSKYLYIATGKADKASILDSMKANKLLSKTSMFDWVASRMKVWERVKPGRYKIDRGQSILSISKMLRNNNQSPVNLVINKLRTPQDLAKVIGKNFEADSVDVISFLQNTDSLSAFNVDDNTLMTLIIPNTYSFLWTTSAPKILKRLQTEQENFWKKNNRLQKAESLGFTSKQVYTIASIVEEETNKNDEKGNIASVYINRYRKGMPLGADPTVKFALKDFSLKRIYHKHLQVASPFNTYRNQGLPPGPICTPSTTTIDAVLNAPQTDYLFFVAKKDFSGYHTFATNYTDHLKYAKEYQKALDEYLLKKQNK